MERLRNGVPGDLGLELLREPAQLVAAEVLRAAGDVGEREHAGGMLGAVVVGEVDVLLHLVREP
jgi:hypothetical protein